MSFRYHDEGWSEERDEAAYFYATEGGDTWHGPPRVPAARERPDPGEYTETEREMTVLIPLYRGRGAGLEELGVCTIVDELDAEHVMRHTWGLSGGYAVRGMTREDGSCRPLFLHRYLLGLQPGDGRQADHLNRDRLDNRRSNLRIVTLAQNNQNCGSRGGTSKFRGVYFDKQRQKWAASIHLPGRFQRLGYFTDELAAARAAQRARREHFPWSTEEPLDEIEDQAIRDRWADEVERETEETW